MEASATIWNYLFGTFYDEVRDPQLCDAKDIVKMVPDASLLGAQHIRIGLASLSSYIFLKK